MSIASPLAPQLAHLRRAERYRLITDEPGRACFQRDRDLLLASPEFARLRDVTQVMAPGGDVEYQTRHSHSLQVARIGRTVAESLLCEVGSREVAEQAGGLDPTVVEAAALAHDLGHPPFGHDAEDELDRLLVAAGVAEGFEANAQSFRVVCALAGSGAPGGMNLTRATLAGILKYPWLRGGNARYPGKWGAYASEAAAFRWVVDALPAPGAPSLEARIMDWADLLAYAVYDFEDFVRSGDIPVEHLRVSATERQWLLNQVFVRRQIHAVDQPMYARVLDRLLADAPQQAGDARRFRNALRCFANNLVAEAIAGVSLRNHGAGINIVTEPEQHAMVMLTEGLTWHYVIDSAMIAPIRAEQRQIIRTLFLAMARPSRDVELSAVGALLERHPAHDEDAVHLRLVADTIASMSERQAMQHYTLLG